MCAASRAAPRAARAARRCNNVLYLRGVEEEEEEAQQES